MASRGHKIEHNGIQMAKNKHELFSRKNQSWRNSKQPLPSPLIAWPDVADIKKHLMSEWDKYMNIDVVSYWFPKQTRKRGCRSVVILQCFISVEEKGLEISKLATCSTPGQPVGSPLFSRTAVVREVGRWERSQNHLIAWALKGVPLARIRCFSLRASS